MRSLIHAALICAATLVGSITVAEAMPVSIQTTMPVAGVAGAQVEKTVLIMRKKRVLVARKKVLVARPRRVIKRVIIR